MDDQKVWWDANQYSAPEIIHDTEVPCSERTLSAKIGRQTRPTWKCIQNKIEQRVSISAENSNFLLIQILRRLLTSLQKLLNIVQGKRSCNGSK